MTEYEFYLLRADHGNRLIRRRGKYPSIEHAYADLEAQGYKVIAIRQLS